MTPKLVNIYIDIIYIYNIHCWINFQYFFVYWCKYISWSDYFEKWYEWNKNVFDENWG